MVINNRYEEHKMGTFSLSFNKRYFPSKKHIRKLKFIRISQEILSIYDMYSQDIWDLNIADERDLFTVTKL